MKLAFVRRNLQKFSFESLIVFGGSATGLLGAFLPWHSIDERYGSLIFSSFTGIAAGMGVFAFLLFAVVFGVFLDRVLESNKFLFLHKRPYFVPWLTLFLGGQVLICLFLAFVTFWLFQDFGDLVSVRFGFLVSLVGGLAVFTGSLLELRLQKKSKALDFFGLRSEGELK